MRRKVARVKLEESPQLKHAARREAGLDVLNAGARARRRAVGSDRCGVDLRAAAPERAATQRRATRPDQRRQRLSGLDPHLPAGVREHDAVRQDDALTRRRQRRQRLRRLCRTHEHVCSDPAWSAEAEAPQLGVGDGEGVLEDLVAELAELVQAGNVQLCCRRRFPLCRRHRERKAGVDAGKFWPRAVMAKRKFGKFGWEPCKEPKNANSISPLSLDDRPRSQQTYQTSALPSRRAARICRRRRQPSARDGSRSFGKFAASAPCHHPPYPRCRRPRSSRAPSPTRGSPTRSQRAPGRS